MGHNIQAIITSTATADLICHRYPMLPRRNTAVGFAIIPINSDFFDVVTHSSRSEPFEDFLWLTSDFQDFLRDLSHLGDLAYVETEYFGGAGGQGGVVFSGGEVRMAPEWGESDVINRALQQVGVRAGIMRDRFSILGLDQVRSNDDIDPCGS